MYNKMEVKTKIKKWGNSLGVLLPITLVRESNVKENDEVVISIKKKKDELMELFGKFNFREPAEKIKFEMKRGWDR